MQSNLDVRWKLNDKGRALLKSDCSNIYDHEDHALNKAAAISAPVISGVCDLASATLEKKEQLPADNLTKTALDEAMPATAATKTATDEENASVNASQKSTSAPTVTAINSEAQIVNNTGITVSATQVVNQSSPVATAAVNLQALEPHLITPVTEDVPFNDIPLPDDELYQANEVPANMAPVPDMAQDTIPQPQNFNQRNSSNSEDIKPRLNWHLRKKRADIYIEEDESIPYLAGLKSFLTSKGITLLAFDTNLHYLPYDLILLRKAHYQHEGQCAFFDDGKATIWSFLQQHFKGRI